MSVIDTHFADPTSTLSVASTVTTMGLWDAFRQANDPVWAAERATRCAAIRAELDAQPAIERTAADALRDIKRYNAQLKVPAVLASKWWTQDVLAKLDTAKDELRTLRGQAVAK